ncbi:T9SS type A sorting domain-containing protein [Aequorivita sp. F47161]|uniref:T9SS type A sorting domain-containing protein n=1 Tax=Aequorivita vitellina TaxID=2874475 RepID=A0A9X1QV16_9FLAO|nr:T9SS type A sorting domain-containing protein [Aequorivita vitellina]MCG2417658.1 T9SS type A sorting domain-containing protein [Aequorivita vitellina]
MKQLTNKPWFAVLFCLLCGSLIAQNNTTASGGNGTGSGGSVSYSVGQVDYIEAVGSGGTANQGVQQPFEIFILGNDEFENINLSAIVYPNPTVNNVLLELTNMEYDELSYSLYDLSGRVLATNLLKNSQTTIVMEGLSAATYFLAISKNNLLLKTFKIIKN